MTDIRQLCCRQRIKRRAVIQWIAVFFLRSRLAGALYAEERGMNSQHKRGSFTGSIGFVLDVYKRQLQKGGEALAAGNFDEKIDTGKLYWDLKRHAEHLNSIGDGMAIAVEQRMKSERLKTELITNVSHDIKTPLTSIINYVDLLQKAHTREEEAQYLEVLQRQSARLKKLTEDLVEASKASTGNISVNPVSYTHLDVYKRQPIWCSACFPARNWWEVSGCGLRQA